MSAKFTNKVMNFLGLDEEMEDEITDENEENAEEEAPEVESVFSKKNNNNNNKLVSIKTAVSAKVLIVKPGNYEEAADICEELKNRKIIVVNTSKLESKIAQRLLDFISGACYALGGLLEEVERGIYIVTPSNIEVSNDLKNELTNKGIFNWTK